MQRRLVGLLHTILADVAGPGIVGYVDLLEVALADAADIAEHVGGLHVVRIVAQQLRLDVDTREAMPVDCELRGLILAQVDPDGYAVETSPAFLELPETFQILVAYLDHLGKLGQGGVEVFDLLRGDLQAVGRAVLCQQHALAVIDESARRRQRQHLHPVFA